MASHGAQSFRTVSTVSTGFSMHDEKTTLAIVSGEVAQLPVALAIAKRVLRAAKAVHNVPRLALFGTGLSDARPEAVANVEVLRALVERGLFDSNGALVEDVDVVVSPHDLALLRLVPSAKFGEVCRVPPCDEALRCNPPPAASELQNKLQNESVESVESVEAFLACLLRAPPIEGADDDGDLPLAWRDHVHDVESFRWARDLWKQSLRDRKAAKKAAERAAEKGVGKDAETAAETPNPFDVLSLCMFAKTVSIAVRTSDLIPSTVRAIVTSTKGAVANGLVDAFTTTNSLEFIEPYLVGDYFPWKVTERGARAAAAARAVLDRIFEHTTRVASVLRRAHLALLLADDESGNKSGGRSGNKSEGVLLVQQSSAYDDLLLERIPTRAVARNGKFEVETTGLSRSSSKSSSKSSSWPSSLNDEFRGVVEALYEDATQSSPSSPSSPSSRSGRSGRSGRSSRSSRSSPSRSSQSVERMLGVYAALSSSHLASPSTRPSGPTRPSRPTRHSLVTTHPVGAAAHIGRELIVRGDRIVPAETTDASVALQRGVNTACTFVSFCPTVAQTLSSPPFSPLDVASVDLSAAQRSVDKIARALQTPTRPLGMLRGTLGGVVELDGAAHRVAFWRLGDDNFDSFATLLPNAYAEICFADYATGSRSLDRNEHAPYDMHDLRTPFFATDTVVTLFDASAVADTDGRAFKISSTSSRTPVLASDEAALYEALRTRLASGAKRGAVLETGLKGTTSFLVRESANDGLAGLRVAWAVRTVRVARVAPRRGAGDGVEDAFETVHLLVSDNTERERVAYS